MFFGKKDKKNKLKCESCGGLGSKKYRFCPHCGNSLIIENDEEDFGLLGKKDVQEEEMFSNLGFMDKTLMSMINSLMKNLDSQMRSQMKGFDSYGKTEVKRFPNGIKIRISGPAQQQRSTPKQKMNLSVEREVPTAQMKKMNSLPREKAKANVKRIGDKIIYELSTPGVNSPEDVFVSKLESGYEVKAIGDKKVYINSLPVNLPLRSYSISNNKLLVEFLAGQEANNFS